MWQQKPGDYKYVGGGLKENAPIQIFNFLYSISVSLKCTLNPSANPGLNSC